MSVNTAIVLVNYNGWADTRQCLESLEHLDREASIILVDNASKENHLAELQAKYPKLRTIASSVNGGWAGGNNLGLEYAYNQGADWIILLNNDTTVSPELVSRLSATVQAHPNLGVVGTVIRFMDEPCDVQTEGVAYNRPDRPGFFQRVSVPLQRTDPPSIVEVDIVNGCCMMVSRKVINAIGFIDEPFFLVHEESDYCLRAQRAGFTNAVLAEALVWHKGSVTFQKQGQGLQRYYDARNLVRLMSRHAGRRQSRDRLRSWTHYLGYVYHRYANERDHGFDATAKAIVKGFYDGLRQRWGPRNDERSRPGLKLLEWCFDRVYQH